MIRMQFLNILWEAARLKPNFTFLRIASTVLPFPTL